MPFNLVMMTCPTCGAIEITKTYTGETKDANFELYALQDAPINVLHGVNHHAPFHCVICGTKFAVGFTDDPKEFVIELGVPTLEMVPEYDIDH